MILITLLLMNILELQILTDDIVETKRFYHNLLEFPILNQSKHSISFKAGETILTFNLSENQQPFYHFAFNIPANQLEEALAWVNQRLEILPVDNQQIIADFKDWNAKAFYFYDNNGSILEFIARYDLHQESMHPFTGNSVCSISEIGLVVDKVSDKSNEIRKEHQLPLFSKQPPSDNFTVIGDDEGLIILVNRNRNWYPTEVKSNSFYTKVVLKNNGHTSTLTSP